MLRLLIHFLQCDLVDNREVSNVEGRDLAKSFGVPFFESSAKSRINVEEAFYELVRTSCFGCVPAGLVLFVCVCLLTLHLVQVREIRRQTVKKSDGPASAPKPKEKKKGGCSIL
jgi:hypothetical protein